MILSARRCSTRVALTDAPASSGVPVDTVAPSPTISTSASSTVAPGSPASFSTAVMSFGATLYCLAPVRVTAHMAVYTLLGQYRLARPPRQPLPWQKCKPDGPPRP